MSNDFFNASGTPSQGGGVTSPNMRAEFSAVAAGFDKLPTLTGNGYKVTYINASGTAIDVVGGSGLLVLSASGIPTVLTPGTGVAAALAVNVGSAGAPVLFNGAGGTPSSMVGTNITGTAAGLTAGNVTTNANLTGHVISTGNAAVLGSFTLAQLNAAVSDADVARTDAANTFTGAQSFPDGAAATPSITHTGDANTGMWFPAADTIAWSVAGAEAYRVSPSGVMVLGDTMNAADWVTTNYKVTKWGRAFTAGSRDSGDSGYLMQGAYFTSDPDSTGANAKYSFTGVGASHHVQQGGTHTFRRAAAGTAGNAITWTDALVIDANNNVLVVSPALLGYGTGAGGTVTQATDKTTAVTLNKPCGQIVMNGAALAAGATVEFVFNNSFITPNSVITFSLPFATASRGYIVAAYPGNGAAFITVKNDTAGSLSNAIAINFAITPTVTA